MGKKNAGTGKQSLPSFLASIPQKAKEPNLKAFRKPTIDITGPIFFGGCNQYHPKPHHILLSSHFTHITAIQSKENIWDNLFADVPAAVKTYPRRKHFRLVKKKIDFVDVWPHRAPGVRVEAGRWVKRFAPNFGKSKSKIKGETIREILRQIPVDSSIRSCEREFYREMKRILLEKNRKLLKPEKRAAHFHFPKAFASVTVVGPAIPASLTVTQLGNTKEEDKEEKAEEEIAAQSEGIFFEEDEEEDQNMDSEELEVDENPCKRYVRMPTNAKNLNRRTVGTQSDLHVAAAEVADAATKKKHFELKSKFSILCKKSAYRNLLQRSITVDDQGRVNVALDLVNNGRSRATQTGCILDETLKRRGESLEAAVPVQFRSPEASLSPSLLSQETLAINEDSKFHCEDVPGTSKLTTPPRSGSASPQLDGREESVEGSLAVIYSCDEKRSLASRVSNVAYLYENQQALRRQSDEAVILVQDYQSYDVLNTARRQEMVNVHPHRPKRFPCKKKKLGRKEGLLRPAPLVGDPPHSVSFVCRICHEGEDVEPLMRPCLCKGSVGYIHARCLKVWLEQSNRSRCEICGYPYAIRQTRKYTKCVSVIVFLREIVERRAMMYDLISFVAVTPLCMVGIAMCIRASIASAAANPVPGSNFQLGNVTKAGMIMLSSTIVVAYTVWLYTLLSYHYKSWKRWYNSCYDVEVIQVNMTSQERLDALHRLEESRRRSSRIETRGSLMTFLQPATSYHSYSSYFQRRVPARVQNLPQ